MNVLITGASGTLGQNILPSLSSFFMKTFELSIKDKPIIDSSSIIKTTLTDDNFEQKLDEIILGESIDLILHMAAHLSIHSLEDWHKTITVNILGTHRLLKWAIKNNVKSICFTSSYIHLNRKNQPFTINSTYVPNSPYALSKLYNEVEIANICKESNLKYFILRIPSYYGPYYVRYWTVLPHMIRSALLDKQIEVYGSGSRRMHFIHTDDIASAVVCSLKSNESGIFHLASTRSVSMLELALLIKRHISNITVIKEQRNDPQEGEQFEIDISDSIKQLGWHPKIDISDGIIDVIKLVNNTLGLQL